jgi:hypothetical protein
LTAASTATLTITAVDLLLRPFPADEMEVFEVSIDVGESGKFDRVVGC